MGVCVDSRNLNESLVLYRQKFDLRDAVKVQVCVTE